nr:MAG TPA: hypothetical protein [Caudoviricetes sp.]
MCRLTILRTRTDQPRSFLSFKARNILINQHKEGHKLA